MFPLSTTQWETLIAEAMELLVPAHECGFFDGGCYTLARAVKHVFPDAVQVAHISRSESRFDHAILHIEGTELYLDADGLQSYGQMMHKMQHLEGVAVTDIWFDVDDRLASKTCYRDIFDFLVERLNTLALEDAA